MSCLSCTSICYLHGALHASSCSRQLVVKRAMWHAHRCKAEPSQLLKTEFGEFTVDNRCWVRNGFSLTQVRVRQVAAYTQALGRTTSFNSVGRTSCSYPCSYSPAHCMCRYTSLA